MLSEEACVHVLIADDLAPELREGLEALGLKVSVEPDLHTDALPDRVRDAHVLVVGDTRVSRRAIARADHLSLIVRAGDGADTIDLAAASERGIYVTHCPGFDAPARAELALGLMIALDRGLAGRPTPGAFGLSGRSLGLVGFGPVAQALQAAAAALGMRTWVNAKELTTSLASEAGVRLCDTLEDLFSRAEVLCLTSDAPTDGPVATAALIDRLPHDALLIALGHPDQVDVDAVKARLKDETLWVACAATAAGEGKGSLGALKGVLVGPGESPLTRQARRAAAAAVIRIIHDYLRTDEVPDCVNLEAGDLGPALLIVRHENKPGSLAAILSVLRDEGINVFQVGNVLFSGAASSCTRLRVSAIPAPDVLERIRRDASVFDLDLVQLP